MLTTRHTVDGANTRQALGRFERQAWGPVKPSEVPSTPL
jgi:hypothetical protein